MQKRTLCWLMMHEEREGLKREGKRRPKYSTQGTARGGSERKIMWLGGVHTTTRTSLPHVRIWRVFAHQEWWNDNVTEVHRSLLTLMTPFHGEGVDDRVRRWLQGQDAGRVLKEAPTICGYRGGHNFKVFHLVTSQLVDDLFQPGAIDFFFSFGFAFPNCAHLDQDLVVCRG